MNGVRWFESNLVRGIVTCLLVVAPWAWGVCQGAEPPVIAFDVPNLLECHEVTTAEFAAANPLERLIRVDFAVSVESRLRGERSLEKVCVRIESADDSLRVHDYSPRTALETSVIGTMQVQGSSEQSRDWNIHLQGQSPGLASGEANANSRELVQSQYHYQQLPPLQLCAASGTIRRGQGVFFKLHSGPRSSLEGAHDFSIVFRVPAHWHGDRLFVHCEAWGKDTSFGGLGTEDRRWAARSFIAAMYRSEDDQSRGRATTYLRWEDELRRRSSASSSRSSVSGASRQKSAAKSLKDLGPLWFAEARWLAEASLFAEKNSADRDWAARLIQDRSPRRRSPAHWPLPDNLPRDLREIATSFILARNGLETAGTSSGYPVADEPDSTLARDSALRHSGER